MFFTKSRTSDPAVHNLVTLARGKRDASRLRRGTDSWVFRIMGVLVVAAGTAMALPRFGTRRSLVEQLARAELPRTAVPRFSVTTVYRPCAPPARGDAVRGADCPENADGDPGADLEALQQRITRAAEAGNHDGMHADAVLALALGDTSARTLGDAIERLARLAAVEAHPAAVLTDLAAAYLMRAGRTNVSYDLSIALDVAEEAVRLEPRNPAALFNRALALEALTLDAAADTAWRDFLHVDSASGWATEARRHVSGLRGIAIVSPSATASEADLRAFAGRAPQEARELGWDTLLAEWADSILAGATTAAEGPLRRAEILGQALERRRGGDASLADAVRAIRAKTGDRAATRRLANAHHWYAAGRAAWKEMNYGAADTLYGRARSYRGDSRPLDAWVEVDYASAEFATRKVTAGLRIATNAVLSTDTVRYPAVGARARWITGTMWVRLEEPDRARTLGRSAGELY
ncbi:MAG TPA: hypothetical protein VF705_14245, partial [Longimicrobium sp.]